MPIDFDFNGIQSINNLKPDIEGNVTVTSDSMYTDLTKSELVNDYIASKANDSETVHLDKTETITGTKTFTEPISLEQGGTVTTVPLKDSDIANKAYVDSQTGGGGGSVVTVGGIGPDEFGDIPLTAMNLYMDGSHAISISDEVSEKANIVHDNLELNEVVINDED
jgi:hypothetical protein